eukprot:scpid93347/ scgid24722/ 
MSQKAIMETNVIVILGLMLAVIGSLDAQTLGETKAAVTFKEKPIATGDVLTDVKVDDVFTCFTPLNNNFQWRYGGECYKKIIEDNNVRTMKRQQIEGREVETLRFNEFVEDGVYACGSCNNTVLFAIHRPGELRIV